VGRSVRAAQYAWHQQRVYMSLPHALQRHVIARYSKPPHRENAEGDGAAPTSMENRPDLVDTIPVKPCNISGTVAVTPH